MKDNPNKISFIQTWRWFGPNDPISLKEIKQTGATGIVTALHQIPVGAVWPAEEILNRKRIIEKEGLIWSVVESLPVHEDIKKQNGKYEEYIENYKTSLHNLGECKIPVVCYNFMPVLDWSRTNLNVVYKDGSITSKFEQQSMTAFDLFILKRKNAEKDYTTDQINSAEKYFNQLDENSKEELLKTILLGLPGSWESYSLDEFRTALAEYDNIDADGLRRNLFSFIKKIISVAEKYGILLAIHPDDPPKSLLGLPRIVSTHEDLRKITEAADSKSNGITLCTGSLGAGYKNNLVEIAEALADRINFVHLRNVSRDESGNFMEEDHLDGDIDLYNVIKTLLIEQKRRKHEGRIDYQIPMRPDHGHLMIPDMNRKGIYPGYSLFGRMRGLSELRGLELGIKRTLQI